MFDVGDMVYVHSGTAQDKGKTGEVQQRIPVIQVEDGELRHYNIYKLDSDPIPFAEDALTLIQRKW